MNSPNRPTTISASTSPAPVPGGSEGAGAGGPSRKLSAADFKTLFIDMIPAPLQTHIAESIPDDELTPLNGADMLSEQPPPHDPVLAPLFDHHALVEIVGPSKTRKSFAALQVALSLAAGRDVFGFECPNPLTVCIADLELCEADLRRRTWRMGRALGITADDIAHRLRFLPLAGRDKVREVIERDSAVFDVLIVDPLYALCDGAEVIETMREPLRWLRKLALKRAAVMFIHHDAKGIPGDRDTRDRGSGSNVTGRSVDARITMTPAAADPDNSVVLAFMCRSYATPRASAWTFTDDAFRPSDVPAEPERASDRRMRQARPKLDGYREPALRILRTDGPMSPAIFKRRVRDELNASKGDADDLTTTLCEAGGPAVRWREGGFATAYKIGTKEQAERASRCLPGSRQEAEEAG